MKRATTSSRASASRSRATGRPSSTPSLRKLAVAGTVTAVVKGGLSVDVGVRAFMPASRSGTRDAAELEALVGQQINCRITKLDVTDEDVVVDRRVVLEEQARGELASRRAALQAGRHRHRHRAHAHAVRRVRRDRAGTRRPAPHQRHLSRPRRQARRRALRRPAAHACAFSRSIPKPKKFLSASSSWSPSHGRLRPNATLPGQRVAGDVTRLMDFGAFVELEPGLEGLIHISEMSWAKKVRHPSDLLKQGDRVDAVILSVKPLTRKRIALGLKQTLADPWFEVERKISRRLASRRSRHQDHELRRLRSDRRRRRRPRAHQRDRRRPPHQPSARRAARGPASSRRSSSPSIPKSARSSSR